jgi:hypothetical protein
MEDQMKGQMGGQHPEECKCPMCQGKMCGAGGCGYGKHNCWYHVVRWILGIAIIVIVFCFGMMIGELKGALTRDSGYRMMHVSSYGGGYGRAYPMTQNVPGMMGGRTQAAPSTQVAPAPAANQ